MNKTLLAIAGRPHRGKHKEGETMFKNRGTKLAMMCIAGFFAVVVLGGSTTGTDTGPPRDPPKTDPDKIVVPVKLGDTPLGFGRSLRDCLADATPPDSPARITVILPPGEYDFGNDPITLSRERVDLIGQSNVAQQQHIFGTEDVLVQKANDVHIENLFVECKSKDPRNAAYAPESDLPLTVVRNCEFKGVEDNGRASLSMKDQIIYAGHYFSCKAGLNSFAANKGGNASGVFMECDGGDYSFGGMALASGQFIRCTGWLASFGGQGIDASGVFERCAGRDYSFGGNGQASGRFIHCAGWDCSFGGRGTAGGTQSSVFEDCTGGDYSFGGWHDPPENNSMGAIRGIFRRCTGGNYAFGGYALAGADFYECYGKKFSFGGGKGTATGNFFNCHGGDASFGGGETEASADGIFTDCDGGNYAFGGSGTTGANSVFTRCRGLDSAFGGNGIAQGTFEYCSGGDWSFGGGKEAQGTFSHCSGKESSFGGKGSAIGNFWCCDGGTYAFGGSDTKQPKIGWATGTFEHCSGGDNSFGGLLGTIPTATGMFNDCNGGVNSFGGASIPTTRAAESTIDGPNMFRYCIGKTGSFTKQGTHYCCIVDGKPYPSPMPCPCPTPCPCGPGEEKKP